MSLNAIISHLELTEQDAFASKEPAPILEPDSAVRLNDKERESAERIFFEKQLKDCDYSMGKDKIKGRIQKAVATARMLYKEIYGG